MKQHGSITYQITKAFNEISKIGESKHEAKEDFKINNTMPGGVDKFMAEFGKETGIYSIQTMKDYITVAVNFANYAKENFGIKDISKLNSDHVKSYLESKADLSKSTIQKYSSALEKFESALSLKYGKDFNFEVKSALTSNVKENLKVVERSGYHPYSDVKAILSNINENNKIKESHKIAIAITAETGLRLHKAITSAGIRIDKSGNIYTQSKGGRIKELNFSADLKAQFLAYMDKTGARSFKLSEKDYKGILSELEFAAKATGQSYEACHGFRHSYALETLNGLQERGLSYSESKYSKEYIQSLDHNREVSAYRRG